MSLSCSSSSLHSLIHSECCRVSDPAPSLRPKQTEVHAVPIRNAKEIAGMRKACRLAREIIDKAHAAVKPGVTTDEIDQIVSTWHCDLFLHHGLSLI